MAEPRGMDAGPSGLQDEIDLAGGRQVQLDMADLPIPRSEREVLRRLAGEVAELAARPIEDEKRDLWYRHNALEPTRPVIFCDPENSWNEIIPASQLECKGSVRYWEVFLRKEIFWAREMGDDYTIKPHFPVPHAYSGMDFHSGADWGLAERRVGGEGSGSYVWESPVKTAEDLEKLHFPEITVDYEATDLVAEVADDIFGDLLPVHIQTAWWWTLGMTWTLAHLRGLEQIMYDMYDNPELLHSLMAILRDGHMAVLDYLEESGLLSLNNDGTYVGSGGLGWSKELPQPDFDGKVRLRDMWGFGDSQETVGVSPDMFAEFIFPYQLPILERFGLNCYGCCEPIDVRWHVVKQIPNLRRVSVSPWADRAKMAEYLGDRYILSMKPRPSDLAMTTVDKERIRAELREALRITRDCRVEVMMKDNHTIRNDPGRVVWWAHMAREEAENL